MDFSLAQSGSWLGILGSVGLLLLGHVANKYVIPYLQIGKRRQYAGLIAQIADEATDDLRAKYSDRQWLERLDEAVDVVIDILGISPEIARRAVRAAAARKK